MIDFIHPKIIATAQLAIAAGTIRFWFKWFGTEHHQAWLPVGYEAHERVFVYPDCLMSILLVVSAALLFSDNPLGASLSLVCGGMMLFLAVIDIAYFYQHGMFAKNRGGKENLGIVLPLAIMSPLMILRFL